MSAADHPPNDDDNYNDNDDDDPLQEKRLPNLLIAPEAYKTCLCFYDFIPE